MPHKEYKCSWIHVKRCREMRKRLLKEFADKEKLFKFVTENNISHSSEVSKQFNLPFAYDWDTAQAHSVRFFNLLFGLKAGIPLSKFESIPEFGRKRTQYINKLFFYLNELVSPTSWHQKWQENIKYFVNLDRQKLTVQDLIDWLAESGVHFEELKAINNASHHSQVNRFIKLTKKLLEECALKI